MSLSTLSSPPFTYTHSNTHTLIRAPAHAHDHTVQVLSDPMSRLMASQGMPVGMSLGAAGGAAGGSGRRRPGGAQAEGEAAAGSGRMKLAASCNGLALRLAVNQLLH